MKKLLAFAFLIFCFSFLPLKVNTAYAIPYYDLEPKDLCLISTFSTSYATSKAERKENVKLATAFIDKTIVDVGKEFSFNLVVGERTKERGFLTANVIVDGKFVEGVGGGVCQVSTTLYNAILLADLCVTEVHPHSLPVPYVEPSFDAMVNSGSADLKFVNDTHNPIIIRGTADGSMLTFSVYGEKMKNTVERESVIKKRLPVKTEYLYDNLNELILSNETERIISYGKAGYISEGYLIKRRNGKIIGKKRIRRDEYKSTKTIILKALQK